MQHHFLPLHVDVKEGALFEVGFQVDFGLKYAPTTAVQVNRVEVAA